MQENSSGSSLTGSGRRQGSWPCLVLVCIEANFSYNEHLFEGAFEVLKHLDGQSPTCPPPSLYFPASSLTALSLCPVHPRSLAVPCCFPPCTESLFGLQDFFLYKIPVHPSRPSWGTICSFKPLWMAYDLGQLAKPLLCFHFLLSKMRLVRIPTSR